MNVYIDASATQQTLFDVNRSYKRVSTDFFPALYYHSTLNDHFVFVIGFANFHKCFVFVIGFANFHKCLTKGAMNVKQIARECSGPPLGSYVLNACIGRVPYVFMLTSLQQHGQTRPH